MVEAKVRAARRSPWRVLAWVLVVCGAFVSALGVAAALVELRFLACGFVCPATGGALIALGGVLVSRVRRAAAFDSDTEPEEVRRRKAKRWARAPEEFEQKQLDRARRAYARYEPRPRTDNPYAEIEPLVVVWWVPQSVLTNGGTIAIALTDSGPATVAVPALSRPGVVLGPSRCPPDVRPFKVRVRAFRVHPDEYQAD